MSDPSVSGPPWSAWDLVEQFDIPIGAARRALARWQREGRIESCGRDAITGATLFPSEQVRAAYTADQRPETDPP